MRSIVLCCQILFLGSFLIQIAGCTRNEKSAPATRPNIIVIVSDDQRYDQFSSDIMPILAEKIGNRGIVFDSAYVTNPACCPSRATILTGMYNSKNGVYGNRYAMNRDTPTLAHYLQRAGYHTGLVGKYLNSWDGSPRPEYDYWFSHRGALVDYINPTFNDNGTFKEFSGYVSHVLFDHAVKFIESAAGTGKPFFLFLTPNAPHDPAVPEEQYRHLFDSAEAYRPPNYNKRGAEKPAHVTRLKALPQKKRQKIDGFYRDQLSTLRSLDDGIGRLLATLEAQGTLASTAIFYISDNGVFLGEFRLKGKSKVYEPAIHVPFLLRYDQLKTEVPFRTNALVGNLDIAPTVLELAGIPVPEEIDGKSLLPLCRREKRQVRQSLLIESWGNRRLRGNKGFMALHTGDSVYIENEDDLTELYELTNDPFQLVNLATDPALQAVLLEKQRNLHQLVAGVRGSVTYEVEAEEVPGFGGAQ